LWLRYIFHQKKIKIPQLFVEVSEKVTRMRLTKRSFGIARAMRDSKDSRFEGFETRYRMWMPRFGSAFTNLCTLYS
jgi:hypothetical protein